MRQLLRPFLFVTLLTSISFPAMAQDPPSDTQATPPAQAPVAESTQVQKTPEVQTIVIKENGTDPYINPEYKESIQDKIKSAKKVSLKISKKVKAKNENWFTESIKEWMGKNGFTVEPTLSRTEEGYTYKVPAPSGQFLDITDPSGKTVRYDLSSFGPHEEFPAYIYYAVIKDDILYLSLASDTFHEFNPDTGFILAISRNDGKILWRSQTLVCKSKNFLIIDDTIICGYGETDHDSHLYSINRWNGEILKKIKLSNKHETDYFFQKDNTIRLVTFDTDYTITYK